MLAKKLTWNDELIKRFWDYESQFPENYFTYQVGDRIALLLEQHVRCESVLDFGCGRGYMIPHLLKHGYHVTAVENSSRSKEYVEREYGNLPNFNGVFSTNELSNLKSKFDAILLLEVIEHIRDEEVDGLLQYLSTLLSENGVLFISCPNDEQLEKANIYCPCCDHVFHRWQHVQSWNVERITQRLEQNGFDAFEVFATNVRWVGDKKRILKNKIKKFLGYRNSERRPNLFALARNKQN